MKIPTQKRRAPGQRAGVDAEAVLAAAKAVYARAGLEGLSMRAVAAQLGVAPNTLYSHVPDRDALLDQLIDAVLGEVALPGPSPSWQEGLRRLMVASREVLLRHADLMPLFLARPTRGPNALRLGEAALTLLAAGGVQGPRAVEALRVLLVYTIGFAAQEAPRRAEPNDDARKAATRAALSRAEGLPHMAAQAAPLAEHPGDATFAAGLDWLLAGVAGARSR